MGCIVAGVGAAELASMCVTVRDSGCGDIPHERHCQVARSEVRRQRLRGATQMAVLGGDAVLSATTAGKSSETAGWEHEARGGDGRNRGENRASSEKSRKQTEVMSASSAATCESDTRDFGSRRRIKEGGRALGCLLLEIGPQMRLLL